MSRRGPQGGCGFWGGGGAGGWDILVARKGWVGSSDNLRKGWVGFCTSDNSVAVTLSSDNIRSVSRPIISADYRTV